MAYFEKCIGQSTEINERQDLLYMLGTYAFFRKLYPKEEDKNVYK
jgi:hypothetical protein